MCADVTVVVPRRRKEGRSELAWLDEGAAGYCVPRGTWRGPRSIWELTSNLKLVREGTKRSTRRQSDSEEVST